VPVPEKHGVFAVSTEHENVADRNEPTLLVLQNRVALTYCCEAQALPGRAWPDETPRTPLLRGRCDNEARLRESFCQGRTDVWGQA